MKSLPDDPIMGLCRKDLETFAEKRGIGGLLVLANASDAFNLSTQPLSVFDIITKMWQKWRFSVMVTKIDAIREVNDFQLFSDEEIRRFARDLNIESTISTTRDWLILKIWSKLCYNARVNKALSHRVVKKVEWNDERIVRALEEVLYLTLREKWRQPTKLLDTFQARANAGLKIYVPRSTGNKFVRLFCKACPDVEKRRIGGKVFYGIGEAGII